MDDNFSTPSHFPKIIVEIKNLENRLVVKSNQLIEANYKLNPREQKFIMLMASHIKKTDTRFAFYRVSQKELIRALQIEGDHRARERLREIIDKLQTKLLKIKEENRLLQTTWISSCAYYENGMIEFEFSENLKPYLLQLKERFTTYQLAHIMKLNSAYSIRIYELLKQYELVGIRKISIEELRKFLGIEPSKYSVFNNFKTRVLDVAQEELADKTDILFEYRLLRFGRFVKDIEFVIKKNPKGDKQLPIIQEIDSDADSVESDEVLLMIELGIPAHKAKEIWLKKWHNLLPETFAVLQGMIQNGYEFNAYLRDKLLLLQMGIAKGSIKNPTGFLLKAIASNWKTVEQIQEEQAEIKRNEQREKDKKQRQKEALKQQKAQEEDQMILMRHEKLDSAYYALPSSIQRDISLKVLEEARQSAFLSKYRDELKAFANSIEQGDDPYNLSQMAFKSGCIDLRRKYTSLYMQ